MAGDRTRHQQKVGVARRGHEVDAKALHIVDRIEQRVDLPVTSVRRADVEVSDLERAAKRARDTLSQTRCKARRLGVGRHHEPTS